MPKFSLFYYLIVTIFYLTDASFHLRRINVIPSTGGNGISNDSTGGNDDFLETYDNNF